jgi:hypothetical protein
LSAPSAAARSSVSSGPPTRARDDGGGAGGRSVAEESRERSWSVGGSPGSIPGTGDENSGTRRLPSRAGRRTRGDSIEGERWGCSGRAGPGETRESFRARGAVLGRRQKAQIDDCPCVGGSSARRRRARARFRKRNPGEANSSKFGRREPARPPAAAGRPRSQAPPAARTVPGIKCKRGNAKHPLSALCAAEWPASDPSFFARQSSPTSCS